MGAFQHIILSILFEHKVEVTAESTPPEIYNKPIYFCVFSRFSNKSHMAIYLINLKYVFFNHNRLCFQKQECIFAKSNREKYYSG
jgi:hypothetical protein